MSSALAVFTRARALAALLVLASLGAAPSVARAQGGEEVAGQQRFKQLVAQGNRAYKAGDLELAAQKFEAAYAINPKPKLLFNIGLIHERMGNLEQAIEYYDRFVVAPDVKLKLRAKAQERLDLLRSIVASRKKNAGSEPEEEELLVDQDAELPTAEDSGADPSLRSETSPDDAGSDQARAQPPASTSTPALAAGAPQDEGGRAAPTSGLIFAGLGVATLATGGVMHLLLDEEMAFVQEPTPEARRQAREARRRNLQISNGLLIGGGALTLGGLSLWLLTRGGEEGAEAASRQWTPLVGPGQVGVRARF